MIKLKVGQKMRSKKYGRIIITGFAEGDERPILGKGGPGVHQHHAWFADGRRSIHDKVADLYMEKEDDVGYQIVDGKEISLEALFAAEASSRLIRCFFSYLQEEMRFEPYLKAEQDFIQNHLVYKGNDKDFYELERLGIIEKVPEPVVEVGVGDWFLCQHGDLWILDEVGSPPVLICISDSSKDYRCPDNIIGYTKLTNAEAHEHIKKVLGLKEEWLDGDTRRCHNCDLYFAHDSRCQECCATKNGEIKRGNWRPKAKEVAK